MKKIVTVLIVALLCLGLLIFSLSGCVFVAATAAGVGGGYIYKEEQDKGRVP